ncbi:MAG TPA: ABC transporter permease [Lachnospiraceae bacterium]|nr:ABC transporter permease [Lachnospiraceae bacterium]
MTLIISVFEQGFIYAIMALGIYITYKILDFPDLTVDGSFPMGAAITAVMINAGIPAVLTLPVAFLAGGFVGMLTGVIHVKLHVRDLLSGIIMMTALYTVNLRIAGKANLPFYNQPTVFDNDAVNGFFPEGMRDFQTVIILLVITAVVKLLLDWYMGTKSGFLLRAVGNNDTLVTSLGVDKGRVRIAGLSIANALVTLGGCLFAQQQRYFDVTMGTGTMVIGLASVIIGTSLFRKVTFMKVTTAVILGSVIYKACVAVAIRLGLAASDMKLVTAVLFLIILVLSMDKKRKVAS